MTTILIYIIAAVVIILLLTKSIFRKIQGYIIFDRIDIQCEVQPVPFVELSRMQPGEPSATIRERVIRARNLDRGDWAERGM